MYDRSGFQLNWKLQFIKHGTHLLKLKTIHNGVKCVLKQYLKFLTTCAFMRNLMNIHRRQNCAFIFRNFNNNLLLWKSTTKKCKNIDTRKWRLYPFTMNFTPLCKSRFAEGFHFWITVQLLRFLCSSLVPAQLCPIDGAESTGEGGGGSWGHGAPLISGRLWNVKDGES